MIFYEKSVEKYGTNSLRREETWKVLYVLRRCKYISNKEIKDFFHTHKYDGSLDNLLKDYPETITAKQIMRIFNCSASRVYRFMHEGYLTYEKDNVNECFVFPKQDVLRIIYCSELIVNEYFKDICPYTCCWIDAINAFAIIPTDKLGAYDAVPLRPMTSEYYVSEFYHFAYAEKENGYANVGYDMCFDKNLEDVAEKFKDFKKANPGTKERRFFGPERIFSYKDVLDGKAIGTFRDDLFKMKKSLAC